MSEDVRVGSVSLSVVPNAEGFFKTLAAKLEPQTKQLGDQLGRTLGKAIQDKVGDPISEPLRRSAPKAGEQAAGEFSRVFKARVQAALRSLPDVNIGADTTDADLKIAGLRTRLEALRSLRIGVDISAADAIAEVELIKADLEQLRRDHPSIQVDVDAGAAITELAAVDALANHLNGKRVNINVSAGGIGGLFSGGAGAGGGAGGLGGLFSGGATFPVGLGLILSSLPALGAVGSVGTAGLGGLITGLTAATAASGAFAAVAIPAFVQVGKASQTLQQAQQASLSYASAVASQRNAEQSLASAQRAAKQAQADLNQARIAAKQNIEDLTLAVQDGALAQRQANLDVQTAKQNLDQVLANPQASQLQREQAQLTYDQAVQQVKDLSVRQQRLVQEQQQATRQGVEGSALVVAAKQRVADANQAVVRAQQQVQLAYAATALAAEKAAKADESAQVAKNILAAFKPVQDGLDAVKQAYEALAKPVQGDVFAVIGDSLKSLANIMPVLTPLFEAASSAVGALAGELLKGLASPEFRSFVQFLADQAGPSMATFGKVIVGFMSGFAGVLQAFGPELPIIERAVSNMAQAFADWGQSLAGSPQIMDFFRFVNQVGPVVAQTLLDMFRAIGSLLSGLRPGAAGSLTFWDTIFKTLGQLGQTVLPPLAQAFGDLMTDLSPLITAFGDIASEVLPPLLIALDGVIKAFGPALPIIAQTSKLFAGLFTDAIKQLLPPFLQFVQASGPLVADMAALLPIVGQIGFAFFAALPFVIPLVDLLLKLATIVIRTVLVPAFDFLARSVIDSMDGIVDALAGAFGWLPFGIGSALKRSRDRMDDFKRNTDTMIDGFNTTIGSTQQPLGVMNLNIAGLGPTMSGLGTPISTLNSNLGTLSGTIHGLGGNLDPAPWRTYAGGLDETNQKLIDINTNIANIILKGPTAAQALDFAGSGSSGGGGAGVARAFAAGGFVLGGIPGRDSVPALLMPGEYVLPTHAVAAIGLSNLESMRHMADGGLVGAASISGVGQQPVQVNVYRLPGEPDDAGATVRALRGLAYEGV